MKQSRTLKLVGTVALVGTMAAIALVGISMNENINSTFLASKVDPEITQAFNNFVSRNQRSFLT
jgi:hypothetical protein